MATLMNMDQKNHEGMNAGMGLVLGIGIGSVLGIAVGAFMAKNKFRSGDTNENLGNKNYEFGQDYGTGGSLRDEDKIIYGLGNNYGVSGYGSGMNDSQTDFNRQKSSNASNSGLRYSQTGYGYVSSKNDEYE